MRLTTQQRHARKVAAQAEAKQFKSDSAAIHADRVMREYEKAYEAANGRGIELRYASGWVRSPGIAGPYRLSELERMTQNLWARLHEQELGDGR